MDPALVIIMSGKRKSGKDYIAALLEERLGKDSCEVLRLSGPLKEQYAKEPKVYPRLLLISFHGDLKPISQATQHMYQGRIEITQDDHNSVSNEQDHNLDYNRLLDSSSYKENHRENMIRWGEDQRKENPGCFCESIVEIGMKSEKPLWLIPDARRLTDICFFQNTFPVLAVRVIAKEETRKERGWKFVDGIDNAESECGLDSFDRWDYLLHNNGSITSLKTQLDDLCSLINIKSGKVS